MSAHINPYKRAHKAFNVNLNLTTTTDDTTLVTAASSTQQLFVTSITFTCETDAAQSITFQDSATSPVYIAKVQTSPGADSQWVFDFGDRGRPLTAGKNLVMNVSAIGLAGHIQVEGYRVGA
jgi:hypothetical protein